MAGHSDKTFQNVYNKNSEFSAQRLIQGIEAQTGALEEIGRGVKSDEHLEESMDQVRKELYANKSKERIKRIYWPKKAICRPSGGIIDRDDC